MNELKYISNKHFASGRLRENFLLNRFFFLILLRTDNDLVVSEMKSKLGVTGFVSEIRRVEN